MKEGNKEVKEFLELFEKAVGKQAQEKKVALLFSAGIDSTLIALQLKALGKEVNCYITGVGSGKDFEEGKKFCRKHEMKLHEVKVTEKELEETLPEIVELVGSASPVEVGIAATLFFGLRAVSKNGFEKAFLGQGADELFAGYAKMRECKKLERECRKLFGELPKIFEKREKKIAEKFCLKLAMPFMEKEIADFALGLKKEFKIVRGENKVLLRRALLALGAGNEVAERKKTAMQYGSGIDKALEKIAKKQGMSKGEFLKGLAANV